MVICSYCGVNNDDSVTHCHFCDTLLGEDNKDAINSFAHQNSEPIVDAPNFNLTKSDYCMAGYVAFITLNLLPSLIHCLLYSSNFRILVDALINPYLYIFVYPVGIFFGWLFQYLEPRLPFSKRIYKGLLFWGIICFLKDLIIFHGQIMVQLIPGYFLSALVFEGMLRKFSPKKRNQEVRTLMKRNHRGKKIKINTVKESSRYLGRPDIFFYAVLKPAHISFFIALGCSVLFVFGIMQPNMSGARGAGFLMMCFGISFLTPIVVFTVNLTLLNGNYKTQKSAFHSGVSLLPLHVGIVVVLLYLFFKYPELFSWFF